LILLSPLSGPWFRRWSAGPTAIGYGVIGAFPRGAARWADNWRQSRIPGFRSPEPISSDWDGKTFPAGSRAELGGAPWRHPAPASPKQARCGWGRCARRLPWIGPRGRACRAAWKVSTAGRSGGSSARALCDQADPGRDIYRRDRAALRQRGLDVRESTALPPDPRAPPRTPATAAPQVAACR